MTVMELLWLFLDPDVSYLAGDVRIFIRRMRCEIVEMTVLLTLQSCSCHGGFLLMLLVKARRRQFIAVQWIVG